MATLKTYVSTIWTAQKTIYSKLTGGMCDLRTVSFELRMAFLTIDVILGVILKALTDKGVVTDTDLQTVLTGAVNATYPVQPVTVPPMDEESGTIPPDPNFGV